MKSFFITLGQLLFSLFMYCMGILFFGLALVPGIALVLRAWSISREVGTFQRLMLLGISLAGGYFLFGLTLVILVGLFRAVLRLRLKEGSYPIFSLGALNWAFLSALYSLINFTFIDFILVTPFSIDLRKSNGIYFIPMEAPKL